MITVDNPEVEFALQAVQKASLLVKHIQKELVSSAITKDDRSPVTVADFASQALVSQMLTETFPGDRLVAEEDSYALKTTAERQTLEDVVRFVGRYVPDTTPENVCGWIDRGKSDPKGRFWTLDPIDGTKGFLRGDQYVVALALIIDGEVQTAVLGCPNMGKRYVPGAEGDGSIVLAVRGQGTWAAPLRSDLSFKVGDDLGEAQGVIRLNVSCQDNSSKARLLRSFESAHTNVGQIEEFVQFLGIRVEPVRLDSQAKYAVLAAGQGDILLRLLSPKKLDYKEKIWDQAAGALVIEQAGGKITDLQGRKLDFSAGRTLANNRGVLASNGYLHMDALKILEKIGA